MLRNKILFPPNLVNVAGGASASEAALAFEAYADLGTPLNDTEKAYLSAYIDSEVTAGNQAKKDYEVLLWLGETNSLVDYIGGKVATAVNAPVFGATGCTFNGTDNYIDTNYNPAVDGVNYNITSSCLEGYLKTSNASTNGFIFGAGSTLYTYKNAVSRLYWRLDGGEENNGGNTDLQDQILHLTRTGTLSAGWRYDGTTEITQKTDLAPPTIANSHVYIGGPSNFYNGSISHFMAGGALPERAAHYTNLTTMLTAASVL